MIETSMKAMNGLTTVLILGCMAAGQAAAQGVVTYEADYTIEYKGREAGASRFTVTRADGEGQFRFVSNSKLRGLVARLVAPNAVVENSLFRIVDGRVEPAAFSYEDGSRKGDDNFTVAFDWPATAELTVEGSTREIALETGVLDRGSAQVALMMDAARGATPATYQIIDDDGLEPYTVTRLEPATARTGAGEFATERYAQQRVGSSRQAVFWFAPELHHVPVRIEQIRDGEAQTVFVLDAVEFTGR